MKIIRYIILSLLSPVALAGCSETYRGEDAGVLRLESIELAMEGAELDEGETTRAVSDFIVNNLTLDPTASMDTRTDWILDLKIYKGASVFAQGQSAFQWNGTQWIPDDPIYFPNYTRQRVVAELAPADWVSGISPLQNSADLLLYQDRLVQYMDQLVLLPAHIPNIRMRHANSMIDFILYEVAEDQIESVYVETAGTQYTPYRVTGSPNIEYLVILPVGVKNPEIVVNTKGGARYRRVLAINATAINSCYCAWLKGLELELSSISVNHWTYGKATAGEYSTVTSYPTFRGPAQESLTVHYDNGLSQTLTFNIRGLVTEKPAGRTIVQIDYDGRQIIIDPPFVIRGMVIDLNIYLLTGG